MPAIFITFSAIYLAGITFLHIFVCSKLYSYEKIP
jgi:hypothetical protein